eukprot:XP_011676074.1 PREDICTED: poliovirus receptor homolog [Strongylocentrotus purpuratus]
MTITNTVIEDEGRYRCTEGAGNFDEAELTVEVESTRSLSVESTTENNTDMYVATCEAVGGRPDETITWMLDYGPSPCDNPVETPIPAGSGLSSKESVCTFQATSEPSAGILTVGFQFLDPGLRVSCDIDVADQPEPSMRNYYIYSNDSLIHQSSTGDNDVEVPDTDLYTKFTCVAGNYLGNTTSQPTKYYSIGPSLVPCDCNGLSSGASAGIAVLAILLIVSVIINIIQFIVWKRQATISETNEMEFA